MELKFLRTCVSVCLSLCVFDSYSHLSLNVNYMAQFLLCSLNSIYVGSFLGNRNLYITLVTETLGCWDWAEWVPICT